MQVKLLSKELDILKAAQEQNSEQFVRFDSSQRGLEKQLKQKEWELEDVKAMSAARSAVTFQSSRVLMCPVLM